ncbi:MAG: signal recognition particle protein [Pirellulaceae bacterium]
MFETLQDGIRSGLKTLRGKGKLSEANMRDGLQLVEQSLLDADVSYDVARDLMEAVSSRAMGRRVLLSLDPSEEVVGIFRDELINILGPVDPSLHLRGELTVIMLCGLQGSGKTTTCGKLARLLLNNHVTPMMVAADLQRPAAIDQLHVIGEQLGVPVYSEKGATDPVKVCRDAKQKAKENGNPVLILDTAGRLAIDEELMAQLQKIDRRIEPDQVYFVVDGMTGQDAVNSSKAFNDALELDGVIMTKLDGDARGGALLSVKHITGVPIKFVGTGEHLDAIEPFRPEGMASRILGLGDILGLVDVARQVVDEKQQQELEEKIRSGEFTLDDFKVQLRSFTQPGLMKKLMGMMPGMGDLSSMMGDDAEGDARRLIGIINSMTLAERRNPKMIDPSRRNRIAIGSGAQPSEVNQLVKQYDMMAPIMKSMAGKGIGGRMQAIRELQESGLLDPGNSRMSRTKQGTGKRLSNKERMKLKKQREKEKRRRRRQ